MRLLPALLIGLISAAPTIAQTAPSTQPATTQPATSSTSAFDPSRHMRVDEVRIGMKGYGMSVLSGTKITKFDVEVITVLKDVLGPQKSVVMIRCNDPFMEHVGPIAGCSGSPIYLYDESGKARLIGAYAFGWDLARDPIIGVQPIEYMLTLEKTPKSASVASSAKNWSLLQSEVFTAFMKPASQRNLIAADPESNSARQLSASAPKLRRLMTPLSVRGMSQSQIDSVAPMLRASGFEPMLSMGGGSDEANDAKIEPGSVLGAAMLSGDLNLSAIGTCTEVIDGRAYGFGHPFNGEGATSIPMGAGAINLVMPVLTSSFKLGAVGKVTGAIDMDGAVGVAGEIGAKAKTFPIVVEVQDDSIGRTKTFHYECAVHQAMSPMLVGMAVQSSLASEKELPRDYTIDYGIEMKFEGDRTIKMSGLATSLNGENVAQSAVWPATLLSSNPFKTANLDGVHVKATIRNEVKDVELVGIAPNTTAFKPGEMVPIQLRLKPYRGDVFEHRVELKLPDELQDGDYSVSIADAAANLQYEIQSKPQHFAVRNIDELFDTLQTVVSESKQDRLFVRFSGTRQNVTIGRTSLEKLPASKRAILEAAGRPDTVASIESSVKSIAMDRPVSGSADMVIHVVSKLP